MWTVSVQMLRAGRDPWAQSSQRGLPGGGGLGLEGVRPGQAERKGESVGSHGVLVTHAPGQSD